MAASYRQRPAAAIANWRLLTRFYPRSIGRSVAGARVGFAACTLIYSAAGLVARLAIAYRWRRELWHRAAAANAH